MYTIRLGAIVLVVTLIMGVSTVLANILQKEYTLDVDEVISRYKDECAGRELTTGTCKVQRSELEEVYFMVFRRMTVSRKKGVVGRKYILLAAQAKEFPALKEIGLWTLDHEGDLSDEEKKLFVAELNSPYSSLRKIAWSTLLKPAVSGPRFDETTLGVDRAYRKVFGKVEYGAPRGMLADKPPEPEWMMAPPFPGSEILYYASGKGGAVYETDKSAAEVLAFYKKNGFESISIKELAEQALLIQNTLMNEIKAKMKADGYSETLSAELQAAQESMRIMPTWLPSYRHVLKDMVLVGEPIKVAGKTTIKPYAAIWTHSKIKKVGIAIPYKPSLWGGDD